MISKVALRRFQAHKNSVLNFSPGTNLILGRSNSGKSSVFRAIEFVLSNRPSGTSFIQDGKGKTSIEVEVDNKLKIVRSRGIRDTGKYVVNGEEFSVVGKSVPEPVHEILDLTDINLQRQLDAHFLILDAPGKVSSFLNRITKLDELVETMGEIRKQKLRAQKKRSEGIEKGEELERVLVDKRIDVFEDFKKLVRKCEKLEKRITKDQDEIQFVEGRLEQIVDTSDYELCLSRFEKAVNQVSKVVSDYEEKRKVYTKISSLVTQIKENAEFVEDKKERLNEINEKILEEKKKIVECPVCGSKLTPVSRKKLLETK